MTSYHDWFVFPFYRLLSTNTSLALLLGLFVLNFLFSCLLAYVLTNYFPLKIMKRKRDSTFLVIFVSTFIPVFGALVCIIAVALLKKFSHDFAPLEINTYANVEYLRVNPVKTKAYGSGWAEIRLQSSRFSPEDRRRALTLLDKGSPRDVNPIYSQLVSDEIEELRICAFSMLETQQDYLQAKINLFLKKLDEKLSKTTRAFFEKQLALLYWELIYRNLSDQEFCTVLLERSQFYVNQALAVLSTDSSLWVLKSRINLRLGLVEEAIDNLHHAAQLKAPTSKITPYLAEIAYDQRDFSTVKTALNQDPALRFILKLNKIYQFWCKT